MKSSSKTTVRAPAFFRNARIPPYMPRGQGHLLSAAFSSSRLAWSIMTITMRGSCFAGSENFRKRQSSVLNSMDWATSVFLAKKKESADGREQEGRHEPGAQSFDPSGHP